MTGLILVECLWFTSSFSLLFTSSFPLFCRVDLFLFRSCEQRARQLWSVLELPTAPKDHMWGSHGRPALTSEYIRTHRVTDCQANVIPYMCHCLSDVNAATLVCSLVAIHVSATTFRDEGFGEIADIARGCHRVRLEAMVLGQSRCAEHSSTSCPDCEAPATPSDPGRTRTHTPEHAHILQNTHKYSLQNTRAQIPHMSKTFGS